MPDPPSLHDLPVDLAMMLAGGQWHLMTIGSSGEPVYQITLPSSEVLYLKTAKAPFAGFLELEHERLLWLRGKLPVPEVRYFLGVAPAHDIYLLTSAVPGLMTHELALRNDIATLVRSLADALRQVHNVPIDECPFDMRLDFRLKGATYRTEMGLVDEDDFDEVRRGRTASELLAELLALRPKDEDLAFTHGDFSLPNILFTPDLRQVGFVDWARGGIADRYQDIALACRSLAYNIGPEWIPLLLDAYGFGTGDAAKLHYYQLLDEFF